MKKTLQIFGVFFFRVLLLELAQKNYLCIFKKYLIKNHHNGLDIIFVNQTFFLKKEGKSKFKTIIWLKLQVKSLRLSVQ